MIENAFLTAIRNYLSQAGLTPAPASIGITEPAAGGDLPAVVLSLEGIRRLAGGLGERDLLISHGALAWTATIDLANPVLPEEPSFRLLNPGRTQLYLPHGGLVRADGTEGDLGSGDLDVRVDGDPVEVASSDPLNGQLTFAGPLAVAGVLTARYYIGQWERRVVSMSGSVRAVVRAADAAAVEQLSGAIIDALQSPLSNAIPGLHSISAASLGVIGPPEPLFLDSRSRDLLFNFEFEQVIDRPDSSGGIIQRVVLNAHLF